MKTNKVETNQEVITYGSDPELHIFSLEKNKMVSAIPVLKRDKHNPINLGDGIKCYHDNILLEAAFPPSTSTEGIINTFRKTFIGVQECLGKKYKLMPLASHVYDDEELKDPESWAIGCSPNFNAWEAGVNTPDPFTDGLRTAGAHFHIGHKKLTDFNIRINAIKLLDVFLGCASIIFDKEKDLSLARRKKYGRASEHRPTDFGLEYRTLSPYVLRSPELVELCMDLINHTLGHIFKGDEQEVLKVINPKEVIEAINTCNYELAEQILAKVELPKSLFKRVKKNYNTNFYETWGIKV